MASKRIYNLPYTLDTQGKGMIADKSGDAVAVFTPTTYHTVATLPASPIASVLYHLTSTNGFAPKGVYTYTNGWSCIEQLEELTLTWSGNVNIVLYTGVSYIVDISADITLLEPTMTTDGDCRLIFNNPDGYDIVNPTGNFIYKTGDEGLSAMMYESVRVIIQRDTVGVNIEYEYSMLDRIKLPIPFVMTWRTPTNNKTVSIPTVSGYTYNGTIDYGDGTGELAFNSWDDSNFSHTYAVAGDYHVKISGLFEAISFEGVPEAEYLLSIDNLGEVGWENLSTAFSGCSNLEYCYGGDTSNVITLGSMFYNCSSIHTIECSKWDVSNVVDMGGLFLYCSLLTELDVSSWDTSNVINMFGLFYYCAELVSIDVSNWDMSNVIHTWNMFNSCLKLTTLDVSNFNMQSVTHLSGMFDYCSSLTELDVSDWDVSNVIESSRTFAECIKLPTIDVSNWDMPNVEDISDMFQGCLAVTELDIVDWDVSKVTNMSGVFNLSAWWDDPDATSLLTLDVSKWDTSSATNMGDLFGGCDQLVEIDVSGFDTSSVTEISGIFTGCSKLTSVDVSGFDMSNAMGMKNMFGDCSSLTALDLSAWVFATSLPSTYSRMSMQEMFEDCSGLTTLDLSDWDVSLVSGYKEMFKGCSGLTTLNLTGWVMNTTGYYKADYFLGMFDGCSSLVDIDVSTWSMVQSGTVVTRMFKNCTAMTNHIDPNQFWLNSNIGNTSYYHGDTFTGSLNIENYSDIPDDWKGI